MPNTITTISTPNSRRYELLKVPCYQVDFSNMSIGKVIRGTKRRVIWKFGFSNRNTNKTSQNNNDQYQQQTGACCRGIEHEILVEYSRASGKHKIIQDKNIVIHDSSCSSSGSELVADSNSFPQRLQPQKRSSLSILMQDGKFEYNWNFKQSPQLPSPSNASLSSATDTTTLSSPTPVTHSMKIVIHYATPSNGKRQYDLLIDGLSYFDMPCINDIGTGKDFTKLSVGILPAVRCGNSSTGRNSASNIIRELPFNVSKLVEQQSKSNIVATKEEGRSPSRTTSTNSISSSSDTPTGTTCSTNSGEITDLLSLFVDLNPPLPAVIPSPPSPLPSTSSYVNYHDTQTAATTAKKPNIAGINPVHFNNNNNTCAVVFRVKNPFLDDALNHNCITPFSRQMSTPFSSVCSKNPFTTTTMIDTIPSSTLPPSLASSFNENTCRNGSNGNNYSQYGWIHTCGRDR